MFGKGCKWSGILYNKSMRGTAPQPLIDVFVGFFTCIIKVFTGMRCGEKQLFVKYEGGETSQQWGQTRCMQRMLTCEVNKEKNISCFLPFQLVCVAWKYVHMLTFESCLNIAYFMSMFAWTLNLSSTWNVNLSSSSSLPAWLACWH